MAGSSRAARVACASLWRRIHGGRDVLVRFAIVPRSLVGCRGVVGLSVVSGGGERASFQKPRTQLLHNWAGWRSWEALKKKKKKNEKPFARGLSPGCLCFLRSVCTSFLRCWRQVSASRGKLLGQGYGLLVSNLTSTCNTRNFCDGISASQVQRRLQLNCLFREMGDRDPRGG